MKFRHFSYIKYSLLDYPVYNYMGRRNFDIFRIDISEYYNARKYKEPRELGLVKSFKYLRKFI